MGGQWIRRETTAAKVLDLEGGVVVKRMDLVEEKGEAFRTLKPISSFVPGFCVVMRPWRSLYFILFKKLINFKSFCLAPLCF